MSEKKKNVIMDAKAMQRSIRRLAHEIVERNNGVENIGLLGIRTRGIHVARRIAKEIEKIEEALAPIGVLDVTLYRDDFRIRRVGPGVQVTDIPFDPDGKTVILVDDVLYTGRTSRAALDALMDFGRPGRVQLAVLVDRGHRELPIKADFVGMNIPTTSSENVKVLMQEHDGEDAVILLAKTSSES